MSVQEVVFLSVGKSRGASRLRRVCDSTSLGFRFVCELETSPLDECSIPVVDPSNRTGKTLLWRFGLGFSSCFAGSTHSGVLCGRGDVLKMLPYPQIARQIIATSTPDQNTSRLLSAFREASMFSRLVRFPIGYGNLSGSGAP